MVNTDHALKANFITTVRENRETKVENSIITIIEII